MEQHTNIQHTRFSWTVWAWAAVMAILVTAGSIWVTPPAHPAKLDGASYIAGAESIGTDQGYRMVELIGAPPITTYPPLHSALMSWVWRVQPEYPANLGLLHGWMQAVGLVALLLVYLEWIRRGLPPWLAGLTCLILGWSGCWQMLTVFCMAEPLFLVLIGATAAWCWRRPNDSVPDWRQARWWLGLGFLAGLMYLARSAAAGIIAGIFVAGVWSKELRRGRNLAGFVLPVVAAAALWALQPKTAQGGYLAYFASRWEELGGPTGALHLGLQQVWDHVGGHSVVGLMSDALERLPQARKLQSYSVGPVIRGIQILAGLGTVALAVRGYLVGRTCGDAGVLTVIGFYLLQLVVWPFSMGARAAIFLLPWVVRWVWRGWTSLGWVSKRPMLRVWVPAILLAGLAASNLLFARLTLGSSMGEEAEEIAAVGQWIRRNVPASEIVGVDIAGVGYDLYRASGRQVLSGSGDEPPRRYDPVPQDRSLRAEFLVVRRGTQPMQRPNWEVRLEQGSLQVLERRTTGKNGPIETHR